jgi:hypothetical protein
MLTEGIVLNHRYRILRVLSDQGGMGVVYQAADQSFSDDTVVIKQSRFTDEYLCRAFEREARLLYKLRHDALPRVIDYFALPDAGQFFVMDFIPGRDLHELLEERLKRGQGPFPVELVLQWADCLLDALHYLHTQESPIIHRDLKPQNLKLRPDGKLFLLDFGLAKGATAGMTAVGSSVRGYTPHYAPLEQIRGKGTDARSDLYSLAITLHHLLTGQIPPDAVARATETLSGNPDPLRPAHELNPQVPLAVSELLQEAAALNQQDRPASAAEMKGALQVARGSELPDDDAGEEDTTPLRSKATPALTAGFERMTALAAKLGSVVLFLGMVLILALKIPSGRAYLTAFVGKARTPAQPAATPGTLAPGEAKVGRAISLVPQPSPAPLIRLALRLRLEAGSGRCFVKVRTDEAANEVQAALRPGEAREFLAREKFIISAGNLLTLKATLNGHPLKLPGSSSNRLAVENVVITRDNYEQFVQ